MSNVESAEIVVTLVPTRVTMTQDGGAADIAVRVRNNGAGVDQYAVEVDGLPTTWYTLSSTSVALFPQDEEDATLTIRPPRGAALRPGTYPFTAVALSRADPSVSARTEGVLEITPVGGFTMTLSPPSVAARTGRYVLKLGNDSNLDLDVALTAADEANALLYTYKPSPAAVEPHSTTDVQLRVRPRRRRWAGPPVAYRFEATAKPSVGDGVTAPAEFVHTPLLKSWLPLVWTLLLILAVLLLGLIGLAVTRGGVNLASVRTSVTTFTCDHVKLFCSTSAPSARRNTPHYVHGFNVLHAGAPRAVGSPLNNEHTIPGGDIIQSTTNGVLIYDVKTHNSYFVGHDGALYRLTPGATRPEHIVRHRAH